MWPYAGTAAAVEQMGAKHINKNVDISFWSNDLLKKSLNALELHDKFILV